LLRARARCRAPQWPAGSRHAADPAARGRAGRTPERALPHRGGRVLHLPGGLHRIHAGRHHRRDRRHHDHRARRHAHGRPDLRGVDGAAQEAGLLLSGPPGQRNPIMNAINEQWPAAPETSVLRLITAGSVDDGKSTLIGRLLVDSKGVFADQLKAIAGSKYTRAPDSGLDLALLTDGLEAEREQGITIDVAYRYFATPVRKFIVADAPGHEQYTRNMVTGASTADAAVILIDASRASDGRLLPQTKRHSTLARLLGLRHIAVAVNKMDLVGWDQAVFERIHAAYRDLAGRLGIADFHIVPLSALSGDNVVRPSERTPWYQGPPLLSLLESLPAEPEKAQDQARFFVQWVIRHNGSGPDAFRGYAGQLQGGTWRVGDAVQVLPSRETARIAGLLRGVQAADQALPGDSITVVLDRDIDLSRGDVLVDADAQP